jgi:hypothetical protein
MTIVKVPAKQCAAVTSQQVLLLLGAVLARCARAHKARSPALHGSKRGSGGGGGGVVALALTGPVVAPVAVSDRSGASVCDSGFGPTSTPASTPASTPISTSASTPPPPSVRPSFHHLLSNAPANVCHFPHSIVCLGCHAAAPAFLRVRGRSHLWEPVWCASVSSVSF